MNLSIAGRDRSADLGSEISARAAELALSETAKRFPPEPESVMTLRAATSESDYMSRLVRLLWVKSGVSTVDFHVPHRGGPVGAAMKLVRRFLWKLLRYQHDRITFQQNTVNSQLAAAVEYLRNEKDAEIRALRERIDRLENERGAR